MEETCIIDVFSSWSSEASLIYFFFQCNVISASRTPKLIGDIMDFKFKI